MKMIIILNYKCVRVMLVKPMHMDDAKYMHHGDIPDDDDFSIVFVKCCGIRHVICLVTLDCNP